MFTRTVLRVAMTRALHAGFICTCFAVQWALAQTTGSIQGKVTDSSGAAILGAVVTVEGANGARSTAVTDQGGAFQISSLPLGNYSIKISASGLSDWTATNVPASVEPNSNSLQAVLQVAPNVTTVTVGLSPEEVATEKFNRELTQRALGVIPNYFVTYDNHPAPLTPKQKFHLGFKTLLDPTTFAAAGITAGIQQSNNSYYQWGQGAEGYAKRFGAAYATAASGLLITSGLANSVLHQDPRYFYSGRGTLGQRAWYAVWTAFVTKGDNGKWQPPYAGVIGSIAAGELSQTYYPGSRSQASLLGRTLMFHFAGLVGVNLVEELLLKKVTSNTPAQSAANAPVLREGTPVPLIALDGLNAQGTMTGKTVNFVLAQDLTVDGKVLARTGDTASGLVGRVSGGETAGEANSVRLGRVTLRAGNVSVPLRSNQVRGVAGPMQYKQLSDSGRVEVMLFVAESVQFPENQ
jgi:Carboxypeptidase regulatory-like domain